MESILVITSILLFFFSYSNKNTKKSLLTIFISLWTAIIVLYSFRFYNLFSAGEDTLRMYFIGIVSFTVGYLIFPSRRFYDNTKPDRFLQMKLLAIYCLAIISLIVYVLKVRLAIPYWVSGGAGEIKSSVIMDNVLDIGPIGDILYTYVARPTQILIVIFSTICIFQKKKMRFLYILTGLMLILGYLCSASKFLIIEIVCMSFVYLYLYNNKKLSDIIKNNKRIFVPLFFVIFFVTFLMSSKGDGLGPTLYSYFCGCLPASDQALERMNGDPNFWGLASLHGFIRICVLPFEMSGLISGVRTALDFVFNYMLQFEETILISPSIKYNAFISMFSYFYIDGGLIGVAFLSCVFGFVSSYINQKANDAPTYKNLCSQLFFANVILLSMVRFQFHMSYYAMSLVYLYLLIPNERIISKYAKC